jgi:FkbM family methyltransferase
VSTQAEREAVRGVIYQIPRVPTILELGAYRGDDSQWMRRACKKGCRYVMVEADPQNCDVIQEKFPEIELYRAAIASRTGEIKFFRSDNDRGSGSVMKPTGHLKFFPSVGFDESVVIRAYTLDDLCDTFSIQPDFIWADIQGAEGVMIEYGRKTLAHVHYLFMEAEETEFYEGQKIREDLLRLLPNWKLLGIFGDNDENVLLENQKFVPWGEE